MKRLPQLLLIGSFLPFCWLAMMGVHELGHVAAAWLTGGSVIKVVVHPLSFSRTDVAPNPHALVVVWGGPLLGVLLPLALWSAWRAARAPAAYLLRFFAGVCLIANGFYLGLGSFGAVGDAGVMLHLGTPIWLLWLFGVTSVVGGMLLWHGLGPHFGLGPARGSVDRRAAYASVGLLVLALILSLSFSSIA
jgi:hypothetical protein